MEEILELVQQWDLENKHVRLYCRHLDQASMWPVVVLTHEHEMQMGSWR